MKRYSPAAERNKDPIAAELVRVLPAAGGLLLEIASGTGQHAAHFARALPAWRIQPSDVDPENLPSIRAFVEEAHAAGLTGLRFPVLLDTRDADWGVSGVDAVFCANMIHISPWESALGLLDGAARLLAPGQPLVLYGPFMRGGRHTAPSNEAFDASLRARDPRWGVRDLDVVTEEAAGRGLALDEVVPMPASNLVVVLRRRS